MEQLGFDFGVEPKRPARVTPARPGAFDDCPRRYRFAYLDRPAPRCTGAFAHNTMGAAVHAALKAVHELPTRRRTPERAAALVTRHWQDAGFADAAQSALYAERARGRVAEYVRSRHPAGLEGGNGNAGEGTVVGLERWVSASVGPGGGRSSLIVEGRIDRIDRIDERGGELVVVDYKTGRTAEHTRESLDEHLRRAEETAGATAAATDTLLAGGDADEAFPARPAPRCGWCEFRPGCPEGRETAPAARPWDLLTPAT